MNINEATVALGQPVPTGDRFWLRFNADDDEVERFAGKLARNSIEFTFEPYPDGEYEVTTKADQEHVVRRLLDDTQVDR